MRKLDGLSLSMVEWQVREGGRDLGSHQVDLAAARRVTSRLVAVGQQSENDSRWIL